MDNIPNIHKKLARLAAVQAMFQAETTKLPIASIIKQFTDSKFQMILDSVEITSFSASLFESLAEGTTAQLADIDAVISQNLASGWTLERIESVSRAMLRVGIYELLFLTETDPVIIVSEYVHMAHAFFAQKEAAFVNGLLNRIARGAHPERFDSLNPEQETLQ